MDAPADKPSSPHRASLWYLCLLALTSFIWAGQGTAVKTLEQAGSEGARLGPIAITFLPFYVTTLLFVPLLGARAAEGSDARQLSAADWWKFAIAGIGGQVIAQLGMTWGTTLSLAQNAAILNLLIPLMTALLASAMLGERLTRLRVLCLVIGLVGVGLMSVKDWQESSFFSQGYLARQLADSGRLPRVGLLQRVLQRLALAFWRSRDS